LLLVLCILRQEYSQVLVDTPLDEVLIELFLDVDVQVIKIRTDVETATFPVRLCGEVGCKGCILVEGDILYYEGTVLDEAFEV
jgi:hypothetical protein